MGGKAPALLDPSVTKDDSSQDRVSRERATDTEHAHVADNTGKDGFWLSERGSCFSAAQLAHFHKAAAARATRRLRAASSGSSIGPARREDSDNKVSLSC